MSRNWFSPTLRDALVAASRAQSMDTLATAIAAHDRYRHGRLADWEAAIEALPDATGQTTCVGPAVTITADVESATVAAIAKQLIPWRKGPFTLADVAIDSEWRCDLKWARLARALPNLADKHVLDVGCGNGYFALRLAAAGAASVIGIDPTTPYVAQFRLLERLGHGLPVTVLPLALEDLSDSKLGFDVVLSAGVLYHRRSPIDHLRELYQRTAPGGMLALETLVVPGDASTVLVPTARYANMRNVWFLPSVDACSRWLERVGFTDIAVADVSTTSVDEQRATDWMPFQSLADALDDEDSATTIEGYPAPTRALIIASR